jgi:hypothetical protein
MLDASQAAALVSAVMSTASFLVVAWVAWTLAVHRRERDIPIHTRLRYPRTHRAELQRREQVRRDKR